MSTGAPGALAAAAAAAAQLPERLRPTAEAARQFIRDRHAVATRRTYASDVVQFKRWAEARGLVAMPAAPETVALILADEATRGIKVATLVHRLSAIRYLHREAGLASSGEAEAVKATWPASGARSAPPSAK